VSIDSRPSVIEYHGQNPCVEPLLLGRILDKLKPLRVKVRSEASTKQDAWADIDALSKSMEATK